MSAAAIGSSATHWAPWLVASICGGELGVNAMYRSGWSAAAANTPTQAVVAVVGAGLEVAR